MSSPLDRARSWLSAEVDDDDRAELSALIAAAESGDVAATNELDDRFRGPLEFGTAGLRGLIGAGESRMNTRVILRATWAVVTHALRAVPDAASRGIVIGHDARRRSLELAEAAAEVAAALGIHVHYLPGYSPTPLVAFATKQLGAAAGVVVTASHNPPAYNGFKVYLDRATQIIPPQDAEIAALIEAAPSPVPRRALAEALAAGQVVDATLVESAYVDAVSSLAVLPVPAAELRVAYTALHGVGERLFRAVMARAGYTQLVSVEAQATPDGSFPTVSFPNPEEPSAMQRVLALGVRTRADLILANDPDADRLAVGCLDADGRATVLTGNEIGILLGDHVLRRGGHRGAGRPLVITTIVSTPQLARIAEAHGAAYREVLTGFKWIANVALDEAASGHEFVFGFEEALGYTVGGVTRDKDGIGAGLVMAELAADLKRQGMSLLDRLREIREMHGLYVSRQRSLTYPGRGGLDTIKGAMASLRAADLESFGGLRVERRWDLGQQERRWSDGRVEPAVDVPRTEALLYALAGGGRVAVRPSGTEPKLKLYFDLVETLAQGETQEQAERRADERIQAVEADVRATAGLS